MYELYIKGHKVDIPDNFSIVWTFNSTDLSMPSAVKNGFSKQIQLPGTPNNNKIFNYLYKIDSNYQYNFNPNKRNEFNLVNNGVLIESGYVQLNKITKSTTNISYSLTLFGGIGDFFYNLDKYDDGTKKTLANLYWKWRPSTELYDNVLTKHWWNDFPYDDTLYPKLTLDQENSDYLYELSPKMIVKSWQELSQNIVSSSDGYSNIRNDIIFMPFDTGIPDIDNFDPTSILIDSDIYNSILNTNWRNKWAKAFPSSIGGTSYSPKTLNTDAGNLIGKFIRATASRNLSQLESGMLISTQMVPAFKINKFIDVIKDPENNGGYDVNFTDAAIDNSIIKDGFVCLDRIKADELNSPIIVAENQRDSIYIKTPNAIMDNGRTLEFMNGSTIKTSLLRQFGVDEISWGFRKAIETRSNIMVGSFPDLSTLKRPGADDGYPYLQLTEVGTHSYIMTAYDDPSRVYVYYGRGMNLPDDHYRPYYRFNGLYMPPTNFKLHNINVRYIGKYVHGDFSYKESYFNGDPSQFKIEVTVDGNSNSTIEAHTTGSYLDPKQPTSPIQNICSFGIFDNDNLPNVTYPLTNNENIHITVFIDLLRFCDIGDTKEIVVVNPYFIEPYHIISNYPIDPTHYVNGRYVPAQVKEILEAAKTKIETYINNKINSSDKTIEAIWYFNRNFQNTVNCYEAPKESFIPSLVSTEVQNVFEDLPYDEYNFSSWSNVMGISKYNCYLNSTIENNCNLTLDETMQQKLLNTFGDEIVVKTEHTWCNVGGKLSDTSNIIVASPSTSTAPVYYWMPVTYRDGKYAANNLKTSSSAVPPGGVYSEANNYKRLASAFPIVNQNVQNKHPMSSSSNKYYFNLATRTLSIFNESEAVNALDKYYITKESLFNNTNTPYEYFISLAKLLNWKFEYNNLTKTVNIMTKDEYYKETQKSLTIDYNNNTDITPYIVDKSAINLSLEPIESYGNYLYNKQTTKIFNNLDVETPYSFNTDTQKLFDKVIFNTGSEYLPQSPLFDPDRTFNKVSYLGSTKIYRWKNATDNDYEAVELIPKIPINQQNISYQYDYPMLCCYDSDYNYVSPKNIIVLFNGFISNTLVPKSANLVVPSEYSNLILSDYNTPVIPKYFGIGTPIPLANKLNEGNSCYIQNFLYNIYNTINDQNPLTYSKNLATTNIYGGNAPWAITRTGDSNTEILSIWPTDIPLFSVYNFMDKENNINKNASSVLLYNSNSYYDINQNLDPIFRFKSHDPKINTSSPDVNWNIPWVITDPFDIWPLRANPVATNQHPFDRLIFTKNGENSLNTIAISSNNINYYKSEITNMIDANARQIKVKARLNMNPKEAIRCIYNLNGGKYIISKIENYNLSEHNPFADVTLQRIVQI